MKKIIVIIISLIILLYGCSLSYASSIGNSVYQTVINYIVANDSNFYSNYLSRQHVAIFDLRNFRESGYNLGRGRYYEKTNSVASARLQNDNQEYFEFVAIFYYGQPSISSGNYNVYKNGVEIQLDRCLNYENSTDSNQSGAERIYLVSNLGNIYKNDNYSNSNGMPFYFSDGIDLVYNDDDIHFVDSSVAYLSTKSTLSTYNVAVSGQETETELYTKIMSWFNSNANYYANQWYHGDKPSVLILNNRNRDIVSSLIDSSNISNHDYICLLSTNRFACYTQNNNSYHYNFYALNCPIWIICVDIGESGNFFFYRYQPQATQRDVAVVTTIDSNRIFYSNSSIISRSNSTNFVIDSNGNLTYFYNSPYENSAVYPVNLIGDSNNNGGIWDEELLSILDAIQDDIEESTGIFSRLFNFVSDDIVNFFRNGINSLINLSPIRFIIDFLADLKQCYDTALANTDNVQLSWSLPFFGNNLVFSPFNFLLNNKSQFFPFLHFLFFILLLKYIYSSCLSIFRR